MTLPTFASFYFAVFCGIAFAGYVAVRARTLPNLVDVLQIVLACAAIASGGSLCLRALAGKTQLGDLSDARFTVVLGGFAVVWVAITTIVDVVRKAHLLVVTTLPPRTGAERSSPGT